MIAALRARGLLHSVTHDGADAMLGEMRRSMGRAPAVYAGFDPTADGLHIGSLVQLMALRLMQRNGLRPIALLGGATGMIGDPSGRDSERSLLSEEEVRRNVEGIRADIERLVDFGPGEHGAELVDNAEWYGAMGAVELLRDVGRHFRVSAMLARESVRARMATDAGISFTEFSYQLLQAHDFLHLYRTRGVRVQLGGSDQWGNITAGVDLIRRVEAGAAVGVTTPLLTTASGTKFGKSAGNAVWLSPTKTSHYDFYQYFVRSEDADVARLLLLFTELPAAEVEAVVAEHRGREEARTAQRCLAEHVTRLVRGEDALASARRVTAILFGHSGASGEPVRMVAEDLGALRAHAPCARLAVELVVGRSVADVAAAAGAVKSKAEARRLIQGGGMYVNGQRVGDAEQRMDRDDLVGGTSVLLRVGKRAFHVVDVAGGTEGAS